MKGIDISMHNRDINFNAVKNDGVEIVIIKATEGVGYVDPSMELHYKKAKAENFKIGFYHFMSEKTDPASQAKCFANVICNKEYSVIPVLDIETNNLNRSSSEVSNRVLQFLSEFKNITGIDCVIYTGGYFGRDLLNDSVKKYKGWIAHYGVNEPMYTGFNVVGHQYTETGRINGVNGNCDVNNFNNGILMDSSTSINNINTNYEDPRVIKIKELQRILGVDDDGKWGPITDAAARDAIAGIKYTTPDLTRWIQLRLGLEPDGIFFTKTEAAVKEWQSNHGLIVDGIAGYNTIKSLALA